MKTLLSLLLAGILLLCLPHAGHTQGSPLIQPPITTGHCAVWTSSYKIGDTGASCAVGSITSITAGVGLTGGTITSSGTIALDLTRLFTSGASGLVPASGGGVTKYLRADGTWQTAVSSVVFGNGLIGGTVTTTGTVQVDPTFLFTNVSSGLVPPSAGGTANYLRADGSWAPPSGTGVSSFSAGTTGFTPSSPTTGAVVLAGTLAAANGGTACTTPSGTCLDNITGFASTGFISRTGAGAYSFTASTGTGSVVRAAAPTITSPVLAGTTTTASGAPMVFNPTAAGVQIGSPVAFATLPVCGSAAAPFGSVLTISDATAPAWHVAIIGGGTAYTQAFCDGTSTWVAQ